MASISVIGSDNMPALDLSTIADGTITTNNNTEIDITATDGTVYKLEGDFSGGSGTTMPTSGAITRWVATAPGDAGTTTINGMDFDVTTFENYLSSGTGEGLYKAIFATDDTFNLTQGTTNSVIGGAGDDHFVMGTTLDASDSIDGNGGIDTVALNGTYSDLVLGATTLTQIDRLVLNGDNSYNITTNDATVAAGHTLVVDARPVTSDGSLTFNGSAETDGNFRFFLGDIGTPLNVTGGAGNDSFHGGGSNATLIGGGGNDRFTFGANFDGTDTIDGGTGVNTVSLDGDYSAGLTFGATSLENINALVLTANNSYDLTLNAANDPSGQTLRVDGSHLHSGDSLTFDGSAVSGNLYLEGGNGSDTLTAGQGHAVFDGALGSDTFITGAKSDHFLYTSVADSNGAHYDTIEGFNAAHDDFTVMNTVNSVDAAVTTGSLSAATFVTDLKADLGATQLHANDAALFTASSGDMAGDTFLVIDQNGVAGYQFDGDLVIQLTGATNLGSLDAASFHATAIIP
jgi:Ca2+-binding RTX toxin-like protein